MPGIDEVGAVSGVPLGGSSVQRGVIRPGDPIPAPPDVRLTLFQVATPGYLVAIGARFLGGRDFTPADAEHAPPVAVVNQAMADALWPGADPIGREILIHTDETTPRMVVGVIGNIRQTRLDRAVLLQYFVPLRQSPRRTMSVVVRGRGPIEQAALGRVVASVDPTLPVYDLRTLDRLMSQSVSERRALALVVAGFGGVALLLAAIGLYGIVSTSVVERRREIGIRVALGASGRLAARAPRAADRSGGSD
jgi:putative ABC transport system permease protein